MRRRTFLAFVPLLAIARDLVAETPRLAAKAVDRLRRVSQSRRDALAKNAEGRSVEALNARIPEIDAILARAREQSPPPKLVVLGMRATPNLGGDYVRRFETIYPAAARAHGAVLVPFLLEGVAGVPRLNQADGVHPTAEGQKMLAETVWKTLEGVLREEVE